MYLMIKITHILKKMVSKSCENVIRMLMMQELESLRALYLRLLLMSLFSFLFRVFTLTHLYASLKLCHAFISDLVESFEKYAGVSG